MSYQNLIAAVKEMRQAQRQYFLTRDRSVLQKSKALETKVDKLINDLESPNLFKP